VNDSTRHRRRRGKETLMKQSLRNLFRTKAVRCSAVPPRRTRPQLEPLEDRAVPAVISYAGLGPDGVLGPQFGLSPNQAFVRGLYIDFLHREGDRTNLNDLAGWVTQLEAGKLTPMQVANDIVHSPEALGVVVDGLYTKLLHRSADAGGRAAFVSRMEQGGTVEGVIGSIVSSQEFGRLADGIDPGFTPGGSNRMFLQSLYTDLLGRSPTDAEASAELSQLSKLPRELGRTSMTGDVLNSTECRTDEVERLYGNGAQSASAVISLFPGLLGRGGSDKPAPSAAEVSGMVQSGQDILALEAVFAGSPEYVTSVSGLGFSYLGPRTDINPAYLA
jgi:hypothetical protein